MDEDEETCVVIDGGSSVFRAGIAGDDLPTCVIPSCIGSSKFVKDKNDRIVGDRVQSMRDLLSLRYPIQRGIVTNWDDLELLMSHCYQKLNVLPEENSLIFSEPPLNPRFQREKLAELIFETFEIPFASIPTSNALCLYCCGRNCGIMVNIGDGVSFAVPYYESHCNWGGVHRQEFAGRDVTHYLQQTLLQRGYSFTTTSEFEDVRDIKEKLSYTSTTPANLDTESDHVSRSGASSYSLSDGSRLNLLEERFNCMEILFQPSKFGYEGVLSIQDMIHKTIESCDIDTRPDILCNIILSGGTVKNSGFRERLQKELELLLPKTIRTRVVCYPEAAESVWIGGSIEGSLTMAKLNRISKARYEEIGPSVVKYLR